MTTVSRWHRPSDGDAWIMGVLNCTPDSFSDGGLFEDVDRAAEYARSMRRDGAAIIDVGGESTRPGSRPVSVEEELRRVMPVVHVLAGEGFFISVDTSKPEVMRQALAAGARMINDVRALSGDPDGMAVVAEAGCDVCLMHMRGTPESMQDHPQYRDVVAEVGDFFQRRVDACLRAGIEESRILLDPGIGFGKRLEDNLLLLASIPRYRRLGFPVLVGVSRKSFLEAMTGAPAGNREIETAAAVSACVLSGVDMLRVHDVSGQARAIKVASAIQTAMKITVNV